LLGGPFCLISAEPIQCCAYGIVVDLSGCKAAHFLAQQGKALRDSVVHPSAYVHPRTGAPEKITRITSLNLGVVENVFNAMKEYVVTVEQLLGEDPTLSTPWLDD
jgi:hypothetical protein